MLPVKLISGVIASVIGFIAYLPYLRDIFRGQTKPHAFSWLSWGVLEIIAFFAQLSKGGGAGTWATGVSSVITLFIAFLAFRNKDRNILPFDWIALGGAALGIILWQTTENQLTAVISVSIADALAFLPTFRKAFHRPQEETLIEFGMSAVKWMLAIAALQTYNLTTWLYPASLVFTNTVFITMALIRRRQLKAKTT